MIGNLRERNLQSKSEFLKTFVLNEKGRFLVIFTSKFVSCTHVKTI